MATMKSNTSALGALLAKARALPEAGITEETDPLFTASPAAGITDEDIARWNAGGGGGADLPFFVLPYEGESGFLNDVVAFILDHGEGLYLNPGLLYENDSYERELGEHLIYIWVNDFSSPDGGHELSINLYTESGLSWYCIPDEDGVWYVGNVDHPASDIIEINSYDEFMDVVQSDAQFPVLVHMRNVFDGGNYINGYYTLDRHIWDGRAFTELLGPNHALYRTNDTEPFTLDYFVYESGVEDMIDEKFGEIDDKLGGIEAALDAILGGGPA